MLAVQKMLREKQTPDEQDLIDRRREYQEVTRETRLDPNARMAQHDDLLQMLVQNPTGSDTGAHQARMESAQGDLFTNLMINAYRQS